MGTVITACVMIRAKCVPERPTLENMMNHGSKNSVPGAIRAKRVNVAGQTSRCQEMA